MIKIEPFIIKDELQKNYINPERFWTVYVHIVPKEIAEEGHDMYYVGVTSRNIWDRWGKQGNSYKKQYFYNVIQKYGWENISHEIIANNLSREEASNFERKLISSLQSNNAQYGYNKTAGGGAYTFENRENLVGKQFGRLTVISDDPSDSGRAICQCSCDNKTIKSIARSNLMNGTITSCGCIALEKLLSHSIKHNMCNTKIYNTWLEFKNACNNPNSSMYNKYGVLGIKFFDEWDKDFSKFYEWAINNGYNENTTHRLNLIDKLKDFSPDNCNWITDQEKMNQRSDVKLFTYNGKTQNLSQWAKELNFDSSVLYGRINKYKWSIEKAFTTPVKKKQAKI